MQTVPHGRISGATSGATLLLVSIGPVQDFIASARRCQDLWYGSWLLSQLSLATARGLAENAGEESLVFPAGLGTGGDGPGLEGAANKLLIVCKQGLDPAIVAQCGRSALNDRLSYFVKRELDSLPQKWGDQTVFRSDVAKKQIEDLVEVAWIAVRLGHGDNAYADARLTAEQWLAARKTTRDWSQPEWPHRRFSAKCSLDGDRDSVLTSALDRCVRDGRKTAEQVRQVFGVKTKEHLSGIGLLKRLGQQRAEQQEHGAPLPPPFHSTSHIASGPTRTRLARLLPGERWRTYVNDLEQTLDLRRYRIRRGARQTTALLHAPKLGDASGEMDSTPTFVTLPRALPGSNQGQTAEFSTNHGLDGVLLFPSRAHDLLDEAGAFGSNDPITPNHINDLQQTTTRLLAEVGIHEPFPYLAVLLADGDKMGDMLNRKAEGPQGQANHRTVSEALNSFTDQALAVIEAHAGSLIYAGGDDVLALVPVHTALSAARELSVTFREALTKTGLFQEGETVPTLSVGLGIGHHMERLPALLDLARAAERLAKVERNSLAILVDKRSGGRYGFHASWAAGANGGPVKRLQDWMGLLSRDDLPDGIAHELEALAGRFEVGTTLAERINLREVIAAECARIIGRKQAQRGTIDLGAQASAMVKTALTPARESEGDTDGQPEINAARDPLTRIRALAHELQVARLLLRAHTEAWGAGPTDDAEETL